MFNRIIGKMRAINPNTEEFWTKRINEERILVLLNQPQFKCSEEYSYCSNHSCQNGYCIV